jgi:hypothetical protein
MPTWVKVTMMAACLVVILLVVLVKWDNPPLQRALVNSRW